MTSYVRGGYADNRKGDAVILYANSSYIPYWTSTQNAFLPYVGYVGKTGHIQDWLFDSAVLMDLSVGNPSISNWSRVLDKTFTGSQRNDVFICDQSNRCEFQLKSKRTTEQVFQKFYLKTRSLNISVKSKSNASASNAGYIGLKLYDKNGFEITDADVIGMNYSPYLRMWYRYIPGNGNFSILNETHFQVVLPEQVHNVEAIVSKWKPYSEFFADSVAIVDPIQRNILKSSFVRNNDSVLVQKFYLQSRKLTMTVNSKSNVSAYNAGYVGLKIYDKNEREITDSEIPGMTYSPYLGMWYRYIPGNGNMSKYSKTEFQVIIPDHAQKVTAYMAKWASGIGQNHFSIESFNMFDPQLQENILVSEGNSVSINLTDGQVASRIGFLKSIVQTTSQKVAFSQIAKAVGDGNQKLLVGFRFYDENGDLIKDTTKVVSDGLLYSKGLDAWFYYLSPGYVDTFVAKEITIPGNVQKVDFLLRNFGDKSDYTFVVKDIKFNNVGSDQNLLNFKNWKSLNYSMYSDGLSAVDGLNQAVRTVARALQDDSNKFGIIMTIPWMSKVVESKNLEMAQKFGEVEGRQLDLSKTEDQITAVKWFIDETLRRWNNLTIEKKDKLYFRGFYWLEEVGHAYKVGDSQEVRDKIEQEKLISAVSEYIRSKGLSFNLSPYNYGFIKPSYEDQYFSYFDNVWLQPNSWPAPTDVGGSMWATEIAANQVCAPTTVEGILKNGIPVCEITDVARTALNKNVSLNLEWRLSPGSNSRGRVMDYIEIFERYGFKEKDVMIYEDAGVVYESSYSRNPLYRAQYDRVYQFLRK